MTTIRDIGSSNLGLIGKIAARGGIIAFFIMAFEVMIMISPFAFFFYSVFNPIFAWLDQYIATRWLTSFFLPHMVLPPTLPLKAIRIAGSFLFVIGLVGFFFLRLAGLSGKDIQMGDRSQGTVRLYPPSAVSVPRRMGRRSGHIMAEVHCTGYPVTHVHSLLFSGKRRRAKDVGAVWRLL